jgi:hypothetical protein
VAILAAGWKPGPLLYPRYGGILPKNDLVPSKRDALISPIVRQSGDSLGRMPILPGMKKETAVVFATKKKARNRPEHVEGRLKG